MSLHTFSLNDGSGEEIVIPKDISDFLIQRQRDADADNAEFERLQKAEKHLREIVEIVDAHDIQIEDCDRRGQLSCDCLERKMKFVREFLQMPGPKPNVPLMCKNETAD